MSVCQRNGQRNGIHDDILYIHMMPPSLLHIFESNLAPGGRVLLADPFRGVSLSLLETLAAAGWQSTLTQWNVGEETTPRAIGVYELIPPSPE